MKAYGVAGPGREYEANPDPRYNVSVREGIVRAIAKHAGRVKSGRSRFTTEQHMDAIQALANSAIDIDRKQK